MFVPGLLFFGINAQPLINLLIPLIGTPGLPSPHHRIREPGQAPGNHSQNGLSQKVAHFQKRMSDCGTERTAQPCKQGTKSARIR